MCNAHNHSYGCTCGFGGEGHSGHRWSDLTNSSPDSGRVSFTSKMAAGDSSKEKESDHRTYTIPCWWCKAQVFYHTNGYGDSVLFDRLGYPWQVHECWELYREVRKDRAAKYERLRDQISLEENRRPSYRRPAPRTPENITYLPHAQSLSKLQILNGFVGSISRGCGSDTSPFCGNYDSSDLWCCVQLEDGTDLGQGVWIPEARANLCEINKLVCIYCRFVPTFSIGRFVCVGTRIQHLNYPAGRCTGVRLVRIGKSLRCRYCGESQAEIQGGWRFDEELRIECETCFEFRGDRTPFEFQGLCDKIATHGRQRKIPSK